MVSNTASRIKGVRKVAPLGMGIGCFLDIEESYDYGKICRAEKTAVELLEVPVKVEELIVQNWMLGVYY